MLRAPTSMVLLESNARRSGIFPHHTEPSQLFLFPLGAHLSFQSLSLWNPHCWNKLKLLLLHPPPMVLTGSNHGRSLFSVFFLVPTSLSHFLYSLSRWHVGLGLMLGLTVLGCEAFGYGFGARAWPVASCSPVGPPPLVPPLISSVLICVWEMRKMF